MLKEIPLRSSKRNEFIGITNEVQKAVKESGVKEGLCLVYCPHTTTGITINENADPSVISDIINFLNKLVPANAGYGHAEGNSDAHIKSALIGRSVAIPVSKGQLVLGTWGGIFYCEFDGPRERKIIVQIIGK